MGLYDSVYLDVECPRCHQVTRRECQTKDLDNTLASYEVGQLVSVNHHTITQLNCIASCHSKTCEELTNKRSGYISGFGYLFDVQIVVNDGRITGKHFIPEIPETD